jgi:hypothetical protein
MDTAATCNSVVRCKYDAAPGSMGGKLKVYNKDKRLVVAATSARSGANGCGPSLDSKQLPKETTMDCRK